MKKKKQKANEFKKKGLLKREVEKRKNNAGYGYAGNGHCIGGEVYKTL
jgi:hypothetical protein